MEIDKEEILKLRVPDFNPRECQPCIDEQDPALQWSDTETECEGGWEGGWEGYEDDNHLEVEVDDEDWEIAEKDFTKQYNRMKQYLAVQSGSVSALTMKAANTKQAKTIAPLPAVNKPRRPQNESTKLSHQQQLEYLSKYSSRIANIDSPYVLRVGVNPKGASQIANFKDKSDRATSEQVLDPRTRIILFKMIGRGLISEVNGCVSTGKEANVYHALSQSPDLPLRTPHVALKIYKTSILIFKDRDRYVTGEYRFRRGYSKRNPRKMVRLWAEKEMRNLKRLKAADVLCPDPFEVRENVLVMSFLGDEQGWASPRLKDASIRHDSYPQLYISLLITIRKMFHTCKLVHADLSEYNILYHEGKLYIIDVSQSVEHDHPNAFNFLRTDLKNVEDFFGKNGVTVVGLRRSFEFITKLDPVFDINPTELLERWMEEPEPEESQAQSTSPSTGHGDARAEILNRVAREQEDAVFMQAYIPRTLNEVYDPERDIDLLRSGKGEKLIYEDTIGIVDGPGSVLSKLRSVRFNDNEELPHTSELGSGSDEGEADEDETTEFKPKKLRGHRHEDKEAKRERKKAVKEEAKEKRKSKMPKAVKEKRIKASRGGKR